MIFSLAEPDGIRNVPRAYRREQEQALLQYSVVCELAALVEVGGGCYIIEYPVARHCPEFLGGRVWDKSGVTRNHGSFWTTSAAKKLLESTRGATVSFAYL